MRRLFLPVIQLSGTAHCTGSQSARAGMVVTAGGLIFIGTPDRKLRAYDQDSGRMLWEKEVSGPINGVPAALRLVVVAAVGTAVYVLLVRWWARDLLEEIARMLVPRLRNSQSR